MENKIYLYINNKSLDNGLLNNFVLLMPAEREAKIRKMRLRKDRENALIAYLLLLLALKNNYDIDHMPDIGYGVLGKPFFTNLSSIKFNFSHCEKGIICGLSDKPIGVDIQEKLKINQNLIKRMFTEEEQNKIYTSFNPEMEFTQLWTMKESILKESGAGISNDMKYAVLKCSKYVQCFSLDDFAISVCSEYKNSRIIDISLAELERTLI